MKIILGEKIEMSQLFSADGTVTPVTIVKAGPCPITQVKDIAKDGYQAVQIGYGKHLKEFRMTEKGEWKKGDTLTVEQFQEGDEAKVTGQSKGKGFQGVVKRHGFHGGPASHGHKDNLRMPGSIGAGGLQRVVKGMRMGGHMGAEQISVRNLKIARVEKDKNLLYLTGAVPGAKNGLLIIQVNG